jgi:acid phosphatase type 7
MKLLGALAALLICPAWAGSGPSTGAAPPEPAVPPTAVHLAVVGDMNGVRTTDPASTSGRNGASIAAALKAGTVDAFLGLGDFQYDAALCADYVSYWKRLWGGTKSRLYWISAPNHDWQPGRNTDLDDFMAGQCPGDRTRSAANEEEGWINNGEPYSFDLGNWHFAMLSTALWRYYPTRAAEVTQWLDQDLAAAKDAGKYLVVAYHDPYFTSGTAQHAPAEEVKPWVDVIDEYDVRLTLSGSQHNYERTCPVLADGTCTSGTGPGTTAFQVSTGGAGLRDFTSTPPYLAARFSDTHGWLRLTLWENGAFWWRFMPVDGPGSDIGGRGPLAS